LQAKLAAREAMDPKASCPSIIETDFAELEDGSLVELIEDPDDSSNTALAVFNGKDARYTRECECKGHLLVPVPRDKNVVRHVRLPRGCKPFQSADRILEQMDTIFSRCLDLEEKYRFLLTSFVLSTWFIDRLPVAPYVALVGLPRSGKSTVLRVLSLLCRRSLVTADITSAAFYRVCDRLAPTLLIDETSTAGEKKKLFHLLRCGISRDVVALRKDQSFKAFGAKVVSWIELPDDAALNSRCIVIPLHESRRTDLKRPTDTDILAAADDLQKQLLQYRFERYKVLSSPTMPNGTRLYSRARDLFEALALPMAENVDACHRLMEALAFQQTFSREPLCPSHAAVLEYLYLKLHTDPYPTSRFPVTTGELTAWVNEFLKSGKRSLRLSPRAVGAALTALGILNRRRTGLGWEVSLDRPEITRIHELAGFYGMEGFAEPISNESREKCEFCTVEDENPVVRLIKSNFG
jgi:hypothetical protein